MTLQHLPDPVLAKPEWPDTLGETDFAALGWKPVPIRQFLFKVFTRCNLNCDYCYVYELADQSWRSKPNTMSTEVVEAAAGQIAEHVAAHDLDEVRIIFHGGEPLLAGRKFLEATIATVRDHVRDATNVGFGMQSNGVLIDATKAKWLADAGISVGISLDGDRQANDRHRRFINKDSSYDKVLRGINCLKEHPGTFTGLLCTIDLANDPIDTYEALVELQPPSVDFLLPHGNWTTPPPSRPLDATTPYADWLIPIFDRWFHARNKVTGIRFFEEIINVILGGRSQVETIGTTPATLVVIETNGDFEQVDALKSAFDGAAGTGASVFRDSVDDILCQPGVAARQLGEQGLCDTCRACPVADVCGGGYYPHRYRLRSGFLNPSVYCPDLLALITHIESTVAAALAAGNS